jgi:protein ImuB
MTAAGAPRRVLVVWCPDWPPDQNGEWVQAARPARDGRSAPDAGTTPEARADARAFEQVVSVVEGFCPRVEVLRPGVCAVGARGPARYFGGEEILARKIIAAVTRRGFACQVGLADGLFAAQLAAQAAGTGREVAQSAGTGPVTAAQAAGLATAQAAGLATAQAAGPATAAQAAGQATPGAPPDRSRTPDAPDAVLLVAPGETPAFLAPHPVSALGNPDLADLLPRLGLRTLGEFAALPATEAANRFGVQGSLAHRLARGLDPRPLAPRPPAADLSVSVAFDPPSEQAEPVVFAAKTLAEQMHASLAAKGLACVRVGVQVTGTDGQEITRLWRHDGLLSALAVAERVRWQLAGWRAAQDVDEGVQPGGITLLRLIPDQLVRDEGHQLGLWGDVVITDQVARAAIRVQALLGHDAVTRPVLAGGRGPPEQVTLVPFGDAAEPLFPGDQPWPGRLPAPAPATICPAPVAAEVTDGSGIEVTITARAMISASPARLSAAGEPWLAITSWAGPWPVTERWWRPDRASRKARFQLVTEDGRAWLATVQGGRWLIEASYE